MKLYARMGLLRPLMRLRAEPSVSPACLVSGIPFVLKPLRFQFGAPFPVRRSTHVFVLACLERGHRGEGWGLWLSGPTRLLRHGLQISLEDLGVPPLPGQALDGTFLRIHILRENSIGAQNFARRYLDSPPQGMTVLHRDQQLGPLRTTVLHFDHSCEANEDLERIGRFHRPLAVERYDFVRGCIRPGPYLFQSVDKEGNPFRPSWGLALELEGVDPQASESLPSTPRPT